MGKKETTSKQNVDNLLTVVATAAVSYTVLDYAWNHTNIVVSFAVAVPMAYLIARAVLITLVAFGIKK